MQSRNETDVKIIDISHHQGAIDWTDVAADGVKGAFIKATEGAGYVDPQFKRNVACAAAVQLPVGFYHYARPETNTAAEEAAHFLDVVKGLHSVFPHVLDVEGAASQIGGTRLTEWCLNWLATVEKSGHAVMIYTGASFAKTYLGKNLDRYPLWIAHYGVDIPMSNSTWLRWEVFQYTSSGKVNGINGNVDVNAMDAEFYKSCTKGEVEVSLFEKIRVSINDVKQITLGDYSTKGSDVRVVRLDPDEWEADFIVAKGKTVEQIAVAANADIAVNFPYFYSGGLIGYSRNKGGITSYDSEPKTYPWHGFAMKEGLPYIGPIAGADVVDFAFKAGPVVIVEGKNVAKERMDIEDIQDDIRARKPRPVIFLDKSGIITIAVVDGWTRKYENKYDQGLNPIELGQLGINLFGAWQGINGDGGGSTTLYIKGEGIVNALQDGSPRAVGHALIFRRKTAAAEGWKQKAVEWLHAQGMTDTVRDPDAAPTWAELGAALMRFGK